jgi:small subunit ribosomal protein S17
MSEVPAPRQQPEVRKKKAAERRRRRERERVKRAERSTVAAPSTPDASEPGRRRVREGLVVSDKADKTITVRIDVTRRHRVYKKIVRESTKLRVHDERNEANAGDTVRVVESRPTSATKRWRLVEVTERVR